MAQRFRFVCGKCDHTIEAWDDGNPYYIDDDGKKKYVYHPNHELLEPDLLVDEYESDGHVAHTGKPYRNTYIAVWRFRDGKVCGVKEFPNPMVAAEALIPAPVGGREGDDLPDDEEE